MFELVKKKIFSFIKPVEKLSHEKDNINDKLNEYLLEKIFFYIPNEDIIKNVSLVCKKCNHIVSNESFWKRKQLIKLQANYKPNEIEISKKFQFLFEKNFLKNSTGHDGFNNWSSLNLNNYIENNSIKKLVKDYYKKKNKNKNWSVKLCSRNFTNHFVTSNGEKIQIIDFNDNYIKIDKELETKWDY